mgnify:CR=1 FL=1
MSQEVIEIDAQRVIAGRDAGMKTAARTNRPDAVFADNDLDALGVIRAPVIQEV